MKNEPANIHRLVDLILDVYPELNPGEVEINTEGQNSIVLILNRAWIFRFPKYEHVAALMKGEAALLFGLQERLPLPIPEPRFLHLDAPPGQAFIGYRRITGEPLWRETFQAIRDPKVIDHLADQLGAFLSALHRLSQVDFPGIHLETSDSLAYYQDFYQRIQHKLFPLMRPDSRQWADRHFGDFLAQPERFSFQPVLRHGDFGTSNLLYDAAQGALTGVLDFSGAALGDPAVDFAGLQISYGEAFVERVRRMYPVSEDFMGRVLFYMGTFALEEALFGCELGDEAALKAGLQDYI